MKDRKETRQQEDLIEKNKVKTDTLKKGAKIKQVRNLSFSLCFLIPSLLS